HIGKGMTIKQKYRVVYEKQMNNAFNLRSKVIRISALSSGYTRSCDEAVARFAAKADPAFIITPTDEIVGNILKVKNALYDNLVPTGAYMCLLYKSDKLMMAKPDEVAETIMAALKRDIPDFEKKRKEKKAKEKKGISFKGNEKLEDQAICKALKEKYCPEPQSLQIKTGTAVISGCMAAGVCPMAEKQAVRQGAVQGKSIG
ncbi:MAG: hypothetical protein FWF01_04680, partial [Alphaproteobacteria bacterium]|nr:hypothetical protein [Alphaproteobacteria bacterium]